MKEKFNIPKKEFDRQAGRVNIEIDPASKSKPVRDGETLEPCIRGLKKINENPELKEKIRRVMSEATSS